MEYKKAQEIKERYMGQIGSIDDTKFKLGQLLILPSNEELRNNFIRSCLANNTELNDYPDKNIDVVLWGIDKDYLNDNNILFYKQFEG